MQEKREKKNFNLPMRLIPFKMLHYNMEFRRLYMVMKMLCLMLRLVVLVCMICGDCVDNTRSIGSCNGFLCSMEIK